MSKTIKLEKNIIESAKIIACKINDKDTRLRTYALNVAASAAAQCLDEMGLETDTKLSLYKISSFDRNFELADIYVNGIRFDVRITFDGKTFTIPKLHEKYDATPAAYIVVKLDKNLDEAEIIGYVEPEEISFEKTDAPYYMLSTDVLKPIENIKEFAETNEANIPAYSAQEHEKIKELSAAFIDDEISESEKVFFIKHVISCPVCRESYCDVNDFDIIVSQLKNYHELLNDSTLSVLSGNKKEVDEAIMANLALVENAQETAEPEEQLTDEQTLGILAEQPETQDLSEEDTLSDDLEILSDEAQTEEQQPIDLQTDETEFVEQDNESLLDVSDNEELISENRQNVLSFDETSDNSEQIKNEETLVEFTEEDMFLEEHKLTEEDSLSPIEPEDLETLEAVDDLVSLEAEEETQESLYNPQTPVELNYDIEETKDVQEESEEISENTDEQPVKESEEEQEIVEDTDLKTTEFDQQTEEASDTAAETYTENEEIQNLLDDDLIALLSEENETDSQEEEHFDNVQESEANAESEYEYEDESHEADSETKFEEEISDNEETPQEADETISTLFENDEQTDSDGSEKEFELAQEPLSEETVNKTKRLAVMAGLLIVLLAAGGGMLFMNHQKSSNDNSLDTSNQGDQMFDFQNKGTQEDSNESPALSQDINRSMTNSFSDKPAAITITKLSWQVSEKLAAEPSVKEYLQTAGKNIQMNLQNDLANSADVAFNNSVKVSFEIAPDNTMKGMQVLESSGSDKIDEAILRSIKNTLKYVSVPKLKDYKSDYFLTLIINF